MAEGLTPQPLPLAKDVAIILIRVLDGYDENLSRATDGVLANFCRQMLQRYLVSGVVNESSACSFQNTMKQFKESFSCCQNISILEENCTTFLHILRDIGGPGLQQVANELENEWRDAIGKLNMRSFLPAGCPSKSSSVPINLVSSISPPTLNHSSYSDRHLYRYSNKSSISVSNHHDNSCRPFVTNNDDKDLSSIPLSPGPSDVTPLVFDTSIQASQRKTRHSDESIQMCSPLSLPQIVPAEETYGHPDVRFRRFASTTSSGSVGERKDFGYIYSLSADDIDIVQHHMRQCHLLQQEITDCESEKKHSERRLRKKHKSKMKSVTRELEEKKEELSKTIIEHNESLKQQEMFLKYVHSSDVRRLEKDLSKTRRQLSKSVYRHEAMSIERENELNERERKLTEIKDNLKNEKSAFRSDKLKYEKDREQLNNELVTHSVKSRELDESVRRFRNKQLRCFIVLFGIIVAILEFAVIILYLAYKTINSTFS